MIPVSRFISPRNPTIRSESRSGATLNLLLCLLELSAGRVRPLLAIRSIQRRLTRLVGFVHHRGLLGGESSGLPDIEPEEHKVDDEYADVDGVVLPPDSLRR
jgi:hypothetical protein